MLTRTTEHAIRAALWLVDHPQGPTSVREIARATGIPPGYLAKVLHTLARAGLVAVQMGPGGGFRLAQPPDAVHLVDVVDAIRPLGVPGRGPGDGPPATDRCPLHARIERAIAAAREVFSDCTLEELSDEIRRGGVDCTPRCTPGPSTAPADQPTTFDPMRPPGRAATRKGSAE